MTGIEGFENPQPKFPQQTERPRLTIGQIAKRTGRSKRTVQRYLEAGKFPGAEMVEGIWRIPLEDVLSAGLPLDRVQNPEPVKEAPKEDTGEDADEWKARALQAEAKVAELNERLLQAKDDTIKAKDEAFAMIERLTEKLSGEQKALGRGWFRRK